MKTLHMASHILKHSEHCSVTVQSVHAHAPAVKANAAATDATAWPQVKLSISHTEYSLVGKCQLLRCLVDLADFFRAGLARQLPRDVLGVHNADDGVDAEEVLDVWVQFESAVGSTG